MNAVVANNRQISELTAAERTSIVASPASESPRLVELESADKEATHRIEEIKGKPINRGGRPKNSNARRVKIGARFSVAERASVKAVAKETGLAVGGLVRMAVLDLIEREAIPKIIGVTQEVRDLYREISRIGVNFNQVARAINTEIRRGPLLAQDLEILSDQCKEIYELMSDVKAALIPDRV